VYLVLQWDGARCAVKMSGVSNTLPDPALLEAYAAGEVLGEAPTAMISAAAAAAVAWRLQQAKQGGADLLVAEAAPLEPQHGDLAGSEHGALAGSQHGALAGSQHGALAGSQHGALAGSQHGALAGSQQGALAGSQQGALAGSQHGALAGHSAREMARAGPRSSLREPAAAAAAGAASSQPPPGPRPFEVATKQR
jgi:hypothetical protein